MKLLVILFLVRLYARINIFKFSNSSELVIFWKCSLGFSKIPIFHLFYELGKTWKYSYTTIVQYFKIPILNPWMNWENYVLIWASLLKIRWGTQIKKGWSHFKLIFISELGKTFSIGEVCLFETVKFWPPSPLVYFCSF